MAKLTTTLKASTLVEVIVAMIIVMLGVAIVTAYVSNNQKGINVSVKVRALMLSDNIIEKYKAQTSFTEDATSISIDGFTVLQSVSNYNNNSNLKLIAVTIADVNGKPIIERKIILLSKYEQEQPSIDQ